VEPHLDGAPGITTERIEGDEACAGAPGSRTRAPGMRRTRSARISRQRRIDAHASSRRSSARRAATPRPTMPATFSVPGRRPCCCPPPWRIGRSGIEPAVTSAPEPFGPWTLCALTAIESTPSVRIEISTLPSAWTASTWTAACGERARTRRAASRTG
jgi:hypothetical protein